MGELQQPEFVRLRFDGKRTKPPAPKLHEFPAAEPDDDGLEVRLLPAEGLSAEQQRVAINALERPVEVEDDATDERPTFTLREAFGILTLVCILLSGVQWFGPALFAFVLGMLALVGLAVRATLPARSFAFEMFWWTTLGVYLMACLIAGITR